MEILKILLSGPLFLLSFSGESPEPSRSPGDGFLFGLVLMNNEVHYSADHYSTFFWLCQQKFSLCAARRGACSDYTEVQWGILLLFSPQYNNIIPKKQE